MKVLIAEDEKISRQILEKFLKKWGYEVILSMDGKECFKKFKESKDIRLMIIDWMMPEMDGLELIRKVRSQGHDNYVYIIILTAKSEVSDIVQGFEAGADDYLTKPFYPDELRKRIAVGERILNLEKDLKNYVARLEESLLRIKRLEGLLPVCMYCKKIRDEKNHWSNIEEYVTKHAEVKFSHGICPECYKREGGNLGIDKKK